MLDILCIAVDCVLHDEAWILSISERVYMGVNENEQLQGVGWLEVSWGAVAFGIL